MAVTTYPLIGKKTVYIGKEQIPSYLVGSEAGKITVKPATTEVNSQSAKISVPNGSYDELSGSVNIILPSWQWLAKIFPNNNFADINGTVVFGAETCKTLDPVPIVIHNECDATGENDVYIPHALLSNGGEFSFNKSDPISLEVSFVPLQGAEGAVIFGVGTPSAPMKYDVAQGKYVSASAAPAGPAPAGH